MKKYFSIRLILTRGPIAKRLTKARSVALFLFFFIVWSIADHSVGKRASETLLTEKFSPQKLPDCRLNQKYVRVNGALV